MKFIKNYCIEIVLLTMILWGCHFNNQYFDREKDKKDAEMITNELYKEIKSKNYENTIPLFSDKFLVVTNREDIMKMYLTLNNKLGDLIDIKLIECKTRVIEGYKASAEYSLTYLNKYSKYEATEKINLIREIDGKIKIISYNLNSKGLME